MILSGEKTMNPDWRFARARKYASQSPTPSLDKGEDKLVAQLVQYMLDSGISRTLSPDDMAAKYGELHSAAILRLESFEGSIRYTMEALALCSTPASEIASICGCSEKLVHKYLDCFFDVTDPARLAAFKNRLHVFMKSYNHRSFCDLGYKFIAVFGGKDRFMRLVVDRSKATPEDLEWLNMDTARLRTMNIWSRTWSQMSDTAPAEDELNLYNSMINAQKASSSADPGSNQEAINLMEKAVPLIKCAVMSSTEVTSKKDEERFS